MVTKLIPIRKLYASGYTFFCEETYFITITAKQTKVKTKLNFNIQMSLFKPIPS